MRFADSKHSYVSLQTLCFTFEFAETVCMLKRCNAASITANPSGLQHMLPIFK